MTDGRLATRLHRHDRRVLGVSCCSHGLPSVPPPPKSEPGPEKVPSACVEKG